MGLFDGDSKTANTKEGGKGRKQEKDKSNTKKRFVQLFLTLHLSRPAFTSFFQYCWMKYGWMKPTVKFPEEFLPCWAPPSMLSTELSVCLRGLLPVHVWCVVLGNLHLFGTIAEDRFSEVTHCPAVCCSATRAFPGCWESTCL